MNTAAFSKASFFGTPIMWLRAEIKDNVYDDQVKTWQNPWP